MTFSTTFSFRSAYGMGFADVVFVCVFFDPNQMLKSFFSWTLETYGKIHTLIGKIRSLVNKFPLIAI